MVDSSKSLCCPNSPKRLDLINPLLFAYFFTLHADQLNLVLRGFSFRLNNAIALLLLIGLLIRFRHLPFRIHRGLVAGVGLVGLSILLSFVCSPYPKRCFFFLVFYAFTALCYVFLPYLLVKHFGIKRVLNLYCLSFVVVGAYALEQAIASVVGVVDPFAHQMIREHLVRPNAFAFEPSYYALYMAIFVMMANFHFIGAFKNPTLSLKQIVLINALLLISTATTAAFAYFVFFFVALAAARNQLLPGFKKRLLRFAFTCGLISMLLFLICPLLVKEFFLKFFFSGFMAHHSFFERWVGIENAWKIFLDHPWVGVGLGGVPPYLLDAWLSNNGHYTYLVAHMLNSQDVPNALKLFEPTNVCTEVLASLGLVGLCAFSMLIVALMKMGKKAIPLNPPLAINLLVSTVVMLIVLQFNQGLLRTYVWTHFALVFACLEKIAFQTSGQSHPILVREKWVESLAAAS